MLQAKVTPATISAFVQTNLIKPAQDILLIQEALQNSSEIARSSILSVFSGNVHIGMSTIDRFQSQDVNENQPNNDIIKKLHTKAWYAFENLLKEVGASVATQHHFNNNYLGKHNRLSVAPNEQGIQKILVELEEVEEAGQELQALKDLFNRVCSEEISEKVKLNKGTFEEKAELIAKLGNLRVRLSNIAQPVHFTKSEVPTVESIYKTLVELKDSKNSAEVEVSEKCRVKIFANGNIDLKLSFGYTTSMFTFSL